VKRSVVMAVTVLVLTVGLASAAYAATVVPIPEALKAAVDSVVSVTGVVKSGAANEYVIEGGGVTVPVGFGPSWNKAVDLTVGETVTITGEIDRGKDGTRATELDGFSVEKPDGTKIEVRTGPGKPPWAGKGGPNGKGAKGAAGADDDADDAPGTEDAD
jgi:uncharacterized protein YdeI (BOF family)